LVVVAAQLLVLSPAVVVQVVVQEPKQTEQIAKDPELPAKVIMVEMAPIRVELVVAVVQAQLVLLLPIIMALLAVTDYNLVFLEQLHTMQVVVVELVTTILVPAVPEATAEVALGEA
jgi:hypothetical protein